jgi:hypothetical protein
VNGLVPASDFLLLRSGEPRARRPEDHRTVNVWLVALFVPSLYQAFTSIM